MCDGAFELVNTRQRQRARGFRSGPSTVLKAGLAVAIAAVSMASGVAGAAEAPRQEKHENLFEITPFVGFMMGGGFEDPADGSQRDVDQDTNFGLMLNLMADVPERQYELLYSTENTTIEGAVPLDLNIQYLQIGGTVAYPQSAHVSPYVGATLGAAYMKPDADGYDDETKLAFSFGGGVRFPITDHFGIRFDVRAFITLLDDDSQIFCVSNGGATCAIRAKSDTFVQYAGSLGFSVGF